MSFWVTFCRKWWTAWGIRWRPKPKRLRSFWTIAWKSYPRNLRLWKKLIRTNLLTCRSKWGRRRWRRSWMRYWWKKSGSCRPLATIIPLSSSKKLGNCFQPKSKTTIPFWLNKSNIWRLWSIKEPKIWKLTLLNMLLKLPLSSFLTTGQRWTNF